MNHSKARVAFASLGCDKNRVDTEMMIASVVDGGYSVVSDVSNADAIIVNTCAFIESARKESIDTIIGLAAAPQRPKVIVCGCLPQLCSRELLEYLQEADCIVGIDQREIVKYLDLTLVNGERGEYGMEQMHISNKDRILTTPSHYAYLKIADGCNNFCTYCTIPYIRGRFRSLPIEDLLTQTRMLCDKGVRELILVAQDVTRYGTDIYGESALCRLLSQLCALDQIKQIRLLYCYPELINKQLLDTVNSNDKIAKYLDIPLQHVCNDILKKMNRRSTEESITRLFDTLQNCYPDIKIRSTFICGFPTETDAQSKQIDIFLQKYHLTNVGFFAYSREEGTVAYAMPQVRQSTKLNRVNRLYALQQRISAKFLNSMVGKTISCIIDKQDKDCWVGRCYFQSPDIDGVCYIKTSRQITVGEIYDVVVTSSGQYDLYGEIK